jgi:FtsP/CotA-like multicopper oxidase with cupredoxin domain
VPNAGSHMYHSHHNSTRQVGMGQLGAFIVEPRNRSEDPKVDVDYVMVLNDGAHGYTLNGKSFPATEPIEAKLGQTVRLRFMNEGMMIRQASGGTSSSRRTTRARGRSTATSSRTRKESTGCSAWSRR